MLIDEKLDGPRLDFSDVFSVASEGAMRAMGIFQAIAYVEPEMGDMGEFAETVAVNRGMPVRIFANVPDAERWLLRQTDSAAENAIFEEYNTQNPYR